jgi:hypothetical protein
MCCAGGLVRRCSTGWGECLNPSVVTPSGTITMITRVSVIRCGAMVPVGGATHGILDRLSGQ